MPQDAATIEIAIEYNDFIAGREIAEILELCDDAVWQELEDIDWPPFERMPFRYYRPPDFHQSPPIFCITKIENGSLLISGVIGGVALKYCYDRFWKGFRRSRFGDSIEELGHFLGNRAASIIERLSEWVSKYENEAKAQKSNIKGIKIKRSSNK